MDQLVQLAGSLLILSAFVAAQRRLLSTEAVAYLVLNLAGSTVLAILAYHERLWGFFLLETVWAGVSAFGLAKRLLTGDGATPA